MTYTVEFQPQEINLVWTVLLNGNVTGKDAPVMTAVLQNIQRSVEEQDAAAQQQTPDHEPKIAAPVETPEIEVEKS